MTTMIMIPPVFEVIGLGTFVQDMWLFCEHLLCPDLAIFVWALSILPKIRCNVNDRLDREKKAAMERGVEKLHLLPSPNKQVAGEPIETILEIFLMEYKNFQKMTGPYEHWPVRFLPDAQVDALTFGMSLILYLRQRFWVMWLAESKSQELGIGPGERSWSDMKHIKDG